MAQNGAFHSFLSSPMLCVQFGLAAVTFLYLKFLFIWRFFRTWALVDGIVPPENMPQCIMATTSISNFWKGWHSSFNKWLVRYMYVPLGGNMKAAASEASRGGKQVAARPWATFVRRIANVALVFTFVAVWHDQKMSLLAWGWLLILCLVPELLVTAAVARDDMAWFRDSFVYRHARALSSALAIIQLILANVIGFSTGLDGGESLAKNSIFDLGDTKHAKDLLCTFAWCFCIAQLSHQIRAEQRRKRV